VPVEGQEAGVARTPTVVSARDERLLRAATAAIEQATARRDKAIIEAHANGVPVTRIAEYTGLARQVIYNRLHAAGALEDDSSEPSVG
jgi:hypothetical protein